MTDRGNILTRMEAGKALQGQAGRRGTGAHTQHGQQESIFRVGNRQEAVSRARAIPDKARAHSPSYDAPQNNSTRPSSWPARRPAGRVKRAMESRMFPARTSSTPADWVAAIKASALLREEAEIVEMISAM